MFRMYCIRLYMYSTYLSHVLINRHVVCIWPLCVGLYADTTDVVISMLLAHTLSLFHTLLYCAFRNLRDCVWQQWSGTLNCCIVLVHHVTYTYLLCFSETHTHTHHSCTQRRTHHRDVYYRNLLTVKRQSILFQMTVVIIRFPSPHHLCHHLYLDRTLGYMKYTHTL